MWLLPTLSPLCKNKKKTLKGAKGASDTRLNRRSLLAGHPVSTTSLVSRSSSISEVDFCELDETEDALLEESSAGKRQSRNCSSSFPVPNNSVPFQKKKKTFRLCTIAPTLIDCFLLTFSSALFHILSSESIVHTQQFVMIHNTVYSVLAGPCISLSGLCFSFI